MDADDLDALLALLSDDDDTGLAAVEALFWGDTDGVDAQLEPLLALEVEATDTLERRGRQQSKEAEAKCDDVQPPTSDTLTSSENKRLTKKEEIVQLRAHVESLTARLKTLKLAAGIGIDTPVARVLPEQTVALASALASEARGGLGLWEKLAARQLERRQASEQENRALRAAVGLQSRRAKRLRLMMQKRAAREEEFAGMLQRPQLLTPLSLRDDQQVLETLAGSIDKTYATIDSTFNQAKMHEVPRPGRLGSGRGRGPGRWSIEIRDVYMVPFAVSQTERAVWNVVSKGAIHHEAEVRKSFQFTFQMPIGVSITMHERSVARRYRDHDRTVIIIRSVTQPAESVCVHGTYRIVIKRGEETTSGPTSIIETYLTGYGTAPAESLASVDDEMRRLRLSNPSVEEDDFGLKQWAKSVSRMHAEVEDALMEPSAEQHASQSQ